MPREGRFFDLFNAHAAQIVEGSHALVQLMANPEAPTVHAERIDHAERSADKITHETIALLHKTFITPIDRDQIHQLINNMDDILDLIQDTRRVDGALRHPAHDPRGAAARPDLPDDVRPREGGRRACSPTCATPRPS